MFSFIHGDKSVNKGIVMRQEGKLKIGVVGLGRWGPNLVRNFANHPRVELTYVCDVVPSAFTRVKGVISRNCVTTTNASEVIESSEVEAVVIATPSSTHFELVRDSLNAGKHVFCEKPLTLDVIKDRELSDLAKRQDLKLMVGFNFLYNNGIKKLKELIQSNRLGQLYSITAKRTHMGLVRDDSSVVWDLAPHDVSIMNYLLDGTPQRVSAVGANPLGQDKPDIAFIHLFYADRIIGQIHVSWVDSNKERAICVIGSKARAVFDDLNPLEPVRLFEKGIGLDDQIESDFGGFKLLLRDGDIISSKIDFQEPLKNMAEVFVGAVLDKAENICDGQFSLGVSQSISAAHRSISNFGASENIVP